MKLSLYFQEVGGHTHVRMFMNGGKCGDLCFRNEQWEVFRRVLDAGYQSHLELLVQDESEEAGERS